ncbi:hypothetical protein EDS67_08925 [candidate division KSB1 bacterium]|nr:MAG: hypothetical protein EDS67_08925 [candidate division KSB1 bacterium]MBC6947346.1 hypothetical protein [candidate division KSB1 bacterium]MCE7941457.1 hypothetical protein [Chlorobi bacterium CHB1]
MAIEAPAGFYVAPVPLASHWSGRTRVVLPRKQMQPPRANLGEELPILMKPGSDGLKKVIASPILIQQRRVWDFTMFFVAVILLGL